MLRAVIVKDKSLNTPQVQQKLLAWFEKAIKVGNLTRKWNNDSRWMTGKDGLHGVRWN